MSAASDACRIDLVLFGAGGWRIGCEARRVRAAHGTPAANAALPKAESVFELPSVGTLATPRQRLTLKCPGGDLDILVGGPLELVSMPITALHPPPPLLAARNYLVGLRGLILQPQRQIILLFDITALTTLPRSDPAIHNIGSQRRQSSR
jgi:hypothetical protein